MGNQAQELSGSIVDWVGTGLSFIAVVVSVIIAFVVSKQSRSIAADQVRQQREAYLAGRMQEIVGHTRAIVLEASTVVSLTSTRVREDLLSIAKEDAPARALRQERISDSLTRLEVEVSLLRAYAVTMPASLGGDSASRAKESIGRLKDEGTWLSSACHFAAFTHFDDEGTWSRDDVLENLAVGHLENVDNRLLAALPEGIDLDNVPKYFEPASPWPQILEERRAILQRHESAWAGEPMSVAANRAVDPVLTRFENALIDVLREWNRSAV
jgi:hypothetical protein